MVSIIPTCCVLVNTPPHYSLSPPVGAEQGFILSHDYSGFLLHGHAKITKELKELKEYEKPAIARFS